MAYLITPSLYNAYRWYLVPRETEEQEAAAKAEFLNTLNKIYTPPTPAIQKGIDFENEIHAVCDGGTSEDPCVNEIAEQCKGGYWQQVLQKRVGNYLLYGKADVINGDKIIDIKYTGSYELNKFEPSIQHLLYMECTPISKFDYLISNRKDVWKESYTKQPDNLETLLSRIDEMVAFIKSVPEFNEAFERNWIAK